MPSSLPLSTPPKPDQQVQKPLVNGTSPENCVNDVLGFISELYSMKSYMEIKNLFEHNKKLQAELDDEKSKCTKSMADLGRRVVEIGEVKKENERLTIESSGLRDENKKFQTESLGLKNQNKKLQTESSELKTQNKGLQTENSNHEKKAAEREEEKKKERAELSRLYLVEKDYEVTKTKLDEIKEEKKELEEEKKKLEKELEREKEQVKELNLIKSYSIGMSSCESKRSEA
jgi:chromosome segregation ATPase